MDFIEKINQLKVKIEQTRDKVSTEEGTKASYITKFLEILNYDPSNPLEVEPEMTCDVCDKNGEKIDYAIKRNDKPIIIVECKHWKQKLKKHVAQLFRYYGANTEVKFGILTNGIEYWFFGDLVATHVMDKKPFFIFNILNFTNKDIEELRNFQKEKFDIDKITGNAAALKYTRVLTEAVKKELEEPTESLIRYFCKDKDVYDGNITSSVIEQFKPLLKDAIETYIQTVITARLQPKESEIVEEEDVEETPKKKVNTTNEEIEGYSIIKSILRTCVDPNRIVYRDAMSYFTIFLDNTKQTLCRLYVEAEKGKKICFLDENKQTTFYPLDSVNDIYKYSKELEAVVNRYLTK